MNYCPACSDWRNRRPPDWSAPPPATCRREGAVSEVRCAACGALLWRGEVRAMRPGEVLELPAGWTFQPLPPGWFFHPAPPPQN